MLLPFVVAPMEIMRFAELGVARRTLHRQRWLVEVHFKVSDSYHVYAVALDEDRQTACMEHSMVLPNIKAEHG